MQENYKLMKGVFNDVHAIERAIQMSKFDSMGSYFSVLIFGEDMATSKVSVWRSCGTFEGQ
jgi:hypothetical protein